MYKICAEKNGKIIGWACKSFNRINDKFKIETVSIGSIDNAIVWERFDVAMRWANNFLPNLKRVDFFLQEFIIGTLLGEWVIGTERYDIKDYAQSINPPTGVDVPPG